MVKKEFFFLLTKIKWRKYCIIGSKKKIRLIEDEIGKHYRKEISLKIGKDMAIISYG